ncbi:Protein RALF-like 24 [Vitis vinifera]|uniref:Protein RALF-like 24 n=1 Tax=Vitis vinifera TaxID=29760 RepID=A0A438DY03_VITVI|nr:Protein RALF-like 24 [Vitis vinifera]
MKENPMTTIYLMLLLLHAHLSICNGLVSVSVVGLNSVKNNEIEAIPKRDSGERWGNAWGGDGLVWEISSRRVLVMQKKYISYETLKKDMIPCARPGASYYNCRASGEANPYNRGCEVITGCARGVRDINS